MSEQLAVLLSTTMEKSCNSKSSERLLDEPPPRWTEAPASRPRASLILNCVLGLIALLMVYIATVLTINMTVNASWKPVEPSMVYSPANVALQYGVTNAWDPTDESPWLHGTFDETEEAWVELLQSVNIGIDEEELFKTQRDFGHTKTAMLTKEGRHVGTLGVYHQLHCLYVLRVALHREEYNITKEQASEALQPHHYDHCIDALRSDVMCHGDVTLYWVEWVKSSREPNSRRIRSSSRRQCANWDMISAWTRDRALPIGEYKVQAGVYESDAGD